jgi:hypothetical protein
MKNLSLFFAGFVALTFAANGQTSNIGPNSVKIGRIEISNPKTPEFQIVGGQTKRYKTGQWLEIEVPFETVPEEIDELTFKITALVEKKLLEGEVTYVNIDKGRDHYAVMYVSPKALDKLTGGKAFNASSGVENVWVEVTRQGQTLAKGSHKPGVAPNVQHVTGMLLSKNATPFAPLYYDRYEEIKPTK